MHICKLSDKDIDSGMEEELIIYSIFCSQKLEQRPYRKEFNRFSSSGRKLFPTKM